MLVNSTSDVEVAGFGIATLPVLAYVSCLDVVSAGRFSIGRVSICRVSGGRVSAGRTSLMEGCRFVAAL